MTDLETRLSRVEKELEDLRQEYADFAYIVSHDLSAPLRHIEGFSTLIMADHQGRFDERTARHFQRIVSSAEESKEILAALLEYSRLNTRQSPFEWVDCNTAVMSARQTLGDMFEETDATLDVADLPSVFCDANQLNKVFYHLLHNALLYRQKDVTPEIRMTCQDSASHWVFCVSDNGIGIKENLQEKVFKVLRRAVTPAQYPGLGMGLAIADKIVKRHGGTMHVKSTPRSGSSFYFSIAKPE